MEYLGEFRIEVDFRFFPGEKFVRANDLTKVIAAIQKSSERLEEDDLFHLIKRVPKSGKGDFDQALKELRRNFDESFRIDQAETGCIKALAAICGVAFAVASFVLDNTAAKTLEHAWGESQYHEEFKDWLQENLLPRADRAEKVINQEMSKTKLDFSISRADQQTIRITINGDHDDNKSRENVPTPVVPEAEQKGRRVRVRNRGTTGSVV